jgi:hypothetical protein
MGGQSHGRWGEVTQVYMVAVIYARGILEPCPAATRRVSALEARALATPPAAWPTPGVAGTLTSSPTCRR